ncbi:unnamed protein product [Heterosigma akashiwo]
MAGGFDALGLCPELVQAVDELGWLLPSDVQDEAIPLLLGGGDVMAAAETGSGKTGAFVLPVLQQASGEMANYRISSGKVPAKKKKDVGPKSSGSKRTMEAAITPLPEHADGGATEPRSVHWGQGPRLLRGGKWYFEMTAETDGLCRVGWATEAASFDLGTCPNGYGFGGTGKKSNARNFDDYGEPFGKGDTIGCYADLNHGEIWFSKNGYEYEAAFGFNPRKGPLFPAVVLKNAAAAFNFGGAPFRFPPTDAMAVAEAQGKHGSGGSFDEDCATGGGGGGGPRRTPMGVILEPSRDLAEQVASCVASYGKYLNAPRLRHALLVGGGDRDAERALREDCDIIVGTIGKVKDCIERRKVNLNQVRFFILDEADRFLETDNLNDILQIYSQLPSGGVGDKRLQVSFFSATLHSPAIADLSAKICHQPTWVDLKGKDSVPDTVHHAVVRVDPGDAAWAWAARVAGVPTDEVHPGGGGGGEEQRSLRLKQLKPLVLKRLIDRLGMEMAMIFCRTNVDCDVLERFLTAQGGGRAFAGKVESGKENPYSCCVLAGMRSQAERRANLQAFREGDVRFLICTDVAARGIDVQGLPYVVNMTLPDVAENYIHRVGRVGRADCMGLAISIVAAPELKEKVWFHTCPNRGRGTQCTRRHLKDDGGCTIW